MRFCEIRGVFAPEIYTAQYPALCQVARNALRKELRARNMVEHGYRIKLVPVEIKRLGALVTSVTFAEV